MTAAWSWPYGRPNTPTPRNPVCGTHGAVLDGGPIRYRCPAGHAVPAADINHEITRGETIP